ncbi:OsmC family protein [Arenibaculum sp.]|jgi:organic hydroperoxide reductase OsmC/OhrA|uniref:OsmC family protein n=1 Tax=Arenibaculum sp. TaxID=2865862 RepID=UPI002E0D6F09|nr:OsmC family protein [Arenibaculum sp.]
MSEYRAEISWQRAGEPFVDGKFGRKHAWTFDGGVTVPASSSPDVVPEPMSDGRAVDPEEALVAALSSCHMLWFLAIAASRGHVVDSYRDEPFGIMEAIGGGKRAITRITLRPEVRFGGAASPATDEIKAMHRKAHENCFIANSIKSEVVLSPVVPEA